MWGKTIGDIFRYPIAKFRYEGTTKDDVLNCHSQNTFYFKSDDLLDFCVSTTKPDKKPVFKVHNVDSENFTFVLLEMK